MTTDTDLEDARDNAKLALLKAIIDAAEKNAEAALQLSEAFAWLQSPAGAH
jgi:hypothetical protein